MSLPQLKYNTDTRYTNVLFLEGVPLDKDYKNTLYWSDINTQTEYFKSKAKINDPNLSYQRINDNSIKVAGNYEDFMLCNYLMFNNTEYENKWYYGFITSVDYISDGVTKINYQLDVLQSYYFDFSFGDCFIERTHVSDDRIGQNIIDEGLDFGDPITKDLTESQNYKQLSTVGFTTLGPDASKGESSSSGDIDPINVQRVNGILTGGYIYSFETDVALARFLANANNQGTTSGIMSLYLVPTTFLGEARAGINGVVRRVGTTQGKTQVIRRNESDLDGYRPKNNKMFTYPYNYLAISATSGGENVLRYEWFKNPNNCVFNEYCTILPNPTALCVPFDYNNDNAGNFTESVSLSNFPICGYETDTYRAWIAQNANTQNFNLEQAPLYKIGAGAISGAMAGGAVGSFVGPVGTLAGVAIGAGSALVSSTVDYFKQRDALNAEKKDRQMLPKTHAGNIASDCLAMTREQTFQYMRKTIRYEYARAIDEFFTMYGYKVNRVGKPNDHVRPVFTYIKTSGCNILGRLPAEANVIISKIHDNGVTYWRNPAQVGNYSLSNK